MEQELQELHYSLEQMRLSWDKNISFTANELAALESLDIFWVNGPPWFYVKRKYKE